MDKERYQPAPEEVVQAESFLTAEEKRLSDEREAAIEQSVPGQFNEKLGSLLIPFDHRLVQLDKLNQLIATEGFNRKPEFHLTILGFTTGKIMLGRLSALPASARAEKVEAVNQLVAATDWTPTSSSDEVYRIAKEYTVASQTEPGGSPERRESVIQMVDLSGTKAFFEKLNELLATDFEVPATHITLYTKSTNPKNATLGIGIKSRAELDRLHPTPVQY